MKKRIITILMTLMLACMSAFVLTACSSSTFEYATFKSQTYMYDGLEKSIEVDGVPNGAVVIYEPTNKYVEVGEYEITAMVSKKGYGTITLTATLTISYSEEYFLKSQVEGYISNLESLMASNKAELEQALANAKTDYEGKISALDTKYAEEVSTIEQTMSANQTAMQQALANAKTDYEGKISALDDKYADEVSTIEQTMSANQTAMEQALANAKTDYEGKISALDDKYADEVNTIEKTISANKTAAEQALANAKAEYQTKLNAIDSKYGQEITIIKNDYNTKINNINTLLSETQATDRSYKTRLEYLEQKIEEILSVQHVWERSYTAKAPTCVEKGLDVYMCKTCHLLKGVEIDMIDHDYESVITEPTYMEQGYTTHTCSVCDDVFVDNYVDPLVKSLAVASYDLSKNENGSIMGYVVENEEDSAFFDLYVIGSGDIKDYGSGYSSDPSDPSPIHTNNYNEKIKNITISENITGIGDHVFGDYTALENVGIPSSVINIGDCAFCYCESLVTITIPNNVKSIGESAFEGCSNLVSVIFEEGSKLEKMSWLMFAGCVNLKDITIPNGVKSIEYGAFLGCYSLKSITIPASVINIDDEAFGWDSRTDIGRIVVDENNTAYASQDGILYNKAKTEILFVPNGLTGTVVIPEGVTELPEEAFDFCNNLNITLPSTIEYIGDRVFANCEKLTITIPKSVTKIDDWAFFSSDGLHIYYQGTRAEWGELNINIIIWCHSYTVTFIDGEQQDYYY